MKLKEIRHDLDSIYCDEFIVQLWVDILSMYIDFLQTTEISERDERLLVYYSQYCADEYGDYIHLARSMTRVFDNSYFDVYDGCREEIPPRSKVKEPHELEISVVPNPNNGHFTIELGSKHSGSFVIFSVSGEEVLSQEFQEVDAIEIDGLTEKGVFIIHLSTTDGHQSSKKVIITE